MSYVDRIADIVGVNKDKIVVKITSCSPEKSKQGMFSIGLKKERAEVAKFSLVEMPGCCGILVSTQSYVAAKYRKKGLGTLLNKMRATIARKWGYSLLICTDVLSNQAQQAILSNNGWKKVTEFVNKRTNNKIGVHVLHLDMEEELGFQL